MKCSGISVSPGVAIGPAYLYQPAEPVVEQVSIAQGQAEEAVRQFNAAKKQANADLAALKAQFDAAKDDKAKIFAAHMDILDDPVMSDEIRALITTRLYAPGWAVDEVFGMYADMLAGVDDQLIQERAADIRDVKVRLLRVLCGCPEVGLSALPGPVVVVARDLAPSDTAALDKKNVLAIVCEVGGPTSHTAILAKSYGIPAILGAAGILDAVQQGATVLVDAVEGEVFCSPTAEETSAMERKRDACEREKAEVQKYLSAEGKMQDGESVQVCLNVGSSKAAELSYAPYVDGVGLFRTEFLFLSGKELPSEQEQFEAYKAVLEAFGDKPVILRTLDIGGDKQIPCLELPREENPFLGNRALRLCFSHPEIFRTQLRAMLRASVYGSLWIMLPMVSSLDDIRRAKSMVADVRAELLREGLPCSEHCKLGIMIEIPAIALLADKAAEEVDFASFGTNDLCQYLTAVDRMSPVVSGYYQSYHPAMFRLIGFAAGEFIKRGKSISVCGELGGDPLAQAVLIGLGIRKLSMSAGSVARTKKLLSGLTSQRTQELAEAVKSMDTAAEVDAYLRSELSAIL